MTTETHECFGTLSGQSSEIQSFLENILASSTAYSIIGNDLEGKILLWNEGARRIYGYEPDEVVGKANSSILYAPEDVQAGRHIEILQTALRHGKWEGKLERVRKTGEQFIARVVITPRRDSKGKAIGYLLISSDISKEIETAQLRVSECRFRSLVEGTSLLVWVADHTGQVEDIPGWRAFTAQSKEEVRGSGWLAALHPDDRDRASAVWQKAITTGGVYEVEYRVRRRDGVYRDFQVRGVPILDTNAIVLEWVGTCTDITAQKQMAEALDQRAQALDRSNKELEQFAYVASHDLQEPLRMITSYVELLAQRYQDKLDDKANKFIYYIVDGATRMQVLINDLLTFSRVSTRGEPFIRTSAEASLLDVLTNLQKAISDKSANVTHDPLPEVMVDPTQFEQLLQNLIANAVKFCQEKPQVHVGAVRRGHEWVFSVRDNGIGIAKEHMERLFVIFQRLHTRSDYPGTGIGLAVCKKVVERHGGRIWIESEPGKGATFFFTIPIRTESQT